MKRLLLLLLACAGLWLAACSSSINASSTSLADRLIAPGGVSTLLDRPRIAAAIAELPNRHGFAPGRDGVPIFWRVFDRVITARATATCRSATRTACRWTPG